MSTDERIIGIIPVDKYSEVHFTISPFREEYFAQMREFLKTGRYTGYTKKGVACRVGTLESIINILDGLSPTQNVNREQEIGKVSKNDVTDVIVRIVKGQKNNYALDIREYLKSDRYEGWTKKGVRISLESFDEVKVFLYACRDELIKVSKKETVYPSENQSNEIILTKIAEKANSYRTELKEILGEKLLKFPQDFIELSNSKQIKEVTLPREPLRLGVFKEGVQYVVSDDDFTLELRNEIEAKYVIYAQLHGAASVHIPEDMFTIFKAVKKYETYARDIRRRAIKYRKERGDKPNVAKYKARLGIEKLGFPWIEEKR